MIDGMRPGVWGCVDKCIYPEKVDRRGVLETNRCYSMMHHVSTLPFLRAFILEISTVLMVLYIWYLIPIVPLHNARFRSGPKGRIEPQLMSHCRDQLVCRIIVSLFVLYNNYVESIHYDNKFTKVGIQDVSCIMYQSFSWPLRNQVSAELWAAGAVMAILLLPTHPI